MSLFARWRKKTPPPETSDELLGNVKQGVIAAIGVLGTRLTQIEQFSKLVDEHATDARKVEARLAKAETQITSLAALVGDHVGRIDSAINQLRGTVTGGMRGRRGQFDELGQALVQLTGSPERAQQLVLELAQQQNGGAGPAVYGMDQNTGMRRE